MKNLDVKDTILKIEKTKPEIEKELKKSTANVKRNESADIHEKLKLCNKRRRCGKGHSRI